MPEFLKLIPPEDAVNLLISNLPTLPDTETIPSQHALGRVTASPVIAKHSLPEFPRTTVDGYAVRAADTYGASENLPSYLDLVGEVPMGNQPVFILDSGQCALIHTGGMVPQGSDAIVMVEYTQQVANQEVEFLRPVAVGENIIKVGEDVHKGAQVIPAGIRLRPPEIGGLMALGVTQVEVAKIPKVGIISTGDEVIPPENRPVAGQVRDVNSYSLKALIDDSGGIGILYGIISDTEDALLDAAAKAKDECDIVVITAGSSASTRDLTSIVIDQLGAPGVLVHGVNVRPGKPTILAVCDGQAMIGLPGNPVSAMVIAGLFVVPAIKHITGEKILRPRPMILAQLMVNLSSQTGREEWVPVELIKDEDGFCANTIFGRSNLIFTLVRSVGLIRIPPAATGLAAGEIVEVLLN